MVDTEFHIDKNIKNALARRKLSRRNLAVGTLADKSAVYRVLNGSTKDPRTSTMIGVCQRIGASMNEILGYPPPTGNESMLNQMQKLPDTDKQRAIELIKIFVETKGVRKARNS